MNLNTLTLEQLKSILQWFESAPCAPQPDKTRTTAPKQLIGEYVIVRARDAGIHAEYLVDYDDRIKELEKVKTAAAKLVSMRVHPPLFHRLKLSSMAGNPYWDDLEKALREVSDA